MKKYTMGKDMGQSQEAVLEKILSPKITGTNVRNKFSKSILDQIVNGRDSSDSINKNKMPTLPIVNEKARSRLGA